jgi:hypothetical protein
MTSWYTTRPLGPWLEPVTTAPTSGAAGGRSRPRGRTPSGCSRDELRTSTAARSCCRSTSRKVICASTACCEPNAKVGFPGVRIAFESKYGPLTYATDEFVTRPARLADQRPRIALALQALRAVDRYGVTKRGEQYTGWKALPAGKAQPRRT